MSESRFVLVFGLVLVLVLSSGGTRTRDTDSEHEHEHEQEVEQESEFRFIGDECCLGPGSAISRNIGEAGGFSDFLCGGELETSAPRVSALADRHAATCFWITT